MTIAKGTKLGRYEIRSKIGEGGMGEVYLALDTELDRTAAIKILPKALASDQQRLRRFVQEAKAASALNHPFIITIYEVGEFSGVHFIATEFIDGETLRQHLRASHMRLSEVLSVAIQVADALVAAHEAGIIHRDIKPENVMLRKRDQIVKVLDFGLAKLIEPTFDVVDTEAATKAMLRTDPGIVMGTVIYMSPEQARGIEVDARTDIWSLGVVIYEMVTGCLPFEGSTLSEALASILNDKEQPPLARFSREAPGELERIVTKALSKDREERYQTTKDLLLDLKRLKRQLEFEIQLERSTPPQAKSEANAVEASDDVAATGAQAQVSTVQKSAASTSEVGPAHPASSVEYFLTEIKQHKKGMLFAAAAIVLIIIGVVALGLYTFLPRKDSAKLPASLQAMKITRITTTGRASQAAVSPDGKYVVHVAIESGQQSLRVRQINTTSDMQIVPLADVEYAGLTFSREGDFIYFVVSDKNSPTNTLYQIPILGGAPQKLIADVANAVTLSPDGRQLAFVRDFPNQGEQALIVANADGGNERRLAARKLPNFFKSLSWSPDGKTLACAAGSFVPSYKSYLVEVSIETGKEKPISTQEWLFMGRVGWLSDGSGLILDASEQGAASFDSRQLWYVSYPGGEARQLTNDLNDYATVSLTADSSRLVAVQSETVSNIWIVPLEDASRATQITRGVGQRDGWNGLAWTTDGKILYASKASGNDDLWSMDQYGGNQRKLTANARINSQPAVSQDGRYFLFTSDRAGSPNIWRMAADGGNPKQLTSGSGENLAQPAPDGKWVLYTLLGAGKPTAPQRELEF